MEEPVNNLGGLLEDVKAVQRASLVRANVLERVRLRPPVRRSLGRRLVSRLPRLRLALPTLAAVGAGLLWWGTRPVPVTFAVGATNVARPTDSSLWSRWTGRGEDSNGAEAGRRGAGGLGIGDALRAPAGGRLPVAFSDGSSLALEQGATARVTATDARGATVQLEQGRAQVYVHHRANTRWQVQAGPFQVAVTGTRFSIEWDQKSEALAVVMSEGTVEVRGSQLAGSGPVVVAAGQRFQATAGRSRWTLASSAQPELAAIGDAPGSATAAIAGDPSNTEESNTGEAVAAPPGEAPPAAISTPTARVAPSAGRSWQALARMGRYQEALQLVERTGFERACRKLGADDLVQLGDVARLARNTARAERAYQVARRRFPRADRPAFALGLVAFEQRQDYRAAGKWFDIYGRRYPSGPLAVEALGREMESWHRAGDAGKARRAARAYLTQASTGPYAPLARQIVSP